MADKDLYADLPAHVKQEIDVRHGKALDEAHKAPPLTREQELRAQAYEHRVMAERVLRDAQAAAEQHLADEARLLALIEVEAEEAARAQEVRDEAARLVKEAKG